jgi:hypothetical protein
MKIRKLKIGVIITLIGIFFTISSYISIQELENDYIFDKEKSTTDQYIIGAEILNNYIMGVGILIFIAGVGFTVFGLIADKKIYDSPKNHQHSKNS